MKRMIRLITALVLVCTVAFGNASFDILDLKKKAEKGDAQAQYNLGLMYVQGDGVVQDYREAAKWCRMAAEQGKAEAQFVLGILYVNGSEAIDKNLQVGMKWLELAAEQGVAEAQVALGGLYYTGEDVAKNNHEALKWFRLAAENGNSDAQFLLSGMYSSGEGVLEDYVEAYAWNLLAMRNGFPQAVDRKEYFKKKMTISQVASGQERAKELMVIVERKRQVAALGADELPAADVEISGSGSGLLVDDGYVLTCWHVVENGQKVSGACGGKDYAATVVQKDAGNDIAVLRVADAPAGVALSFADSVKLDEPIFTMGFPHPDLQGSDVKFTTGSISGLTGPRNAPLYYQISVPLQSGNSGGPLFDEYGNLVGIVAAKLDSLVTLAATGDLPQNVNYAIKSDYLVPLLKTVDGIKVQPSQTKPVNLLSLVEELKKSVVMIKVY